jgi:hypothetical protein
LFRYRRNPEKLSKTMTKDDADRLYDVKDLVREAIAELEAADDKGIGKEPLILLGAIDRYIDKITLASKASQRLAPVIEFSSQRCDTVHLPARVAVQVATPLRAR